MRHGDGLLPHLGILEKMLPRKSNLSIKTLCKPSRKEVHFHEKNTIDYI